MCDQNMSARGFGQNPGCTGFFLCFQQGVINEFDNHRRQHDHHHDEAGDIDNHCEDLAEIGFERNVAKTLRRHDDERPVNTRCKRIAASFVGHKDLEENRIQNKQD